MKFNMLNSARHPLPLQTRTFIRRFTRWSRQAALWSACLLGSTSIASAQNFGPTPGMPVMPVMPGGPRLPGPVSGPVRPALPRVTTQQTLIQMATGHSVCIVIGEGIASSFVGNTTVDEGPFQDFIMGAQVNGMQKTNAQTSIDFTPDQNAARMLFVLKGVTANETVAQLPRAAVRSAGTFHFELTKQIEFNGHDIRTWSPAAFMTIHQQNLGASTPVNNVPLLGPLASNIVLNVADQRKPMSEGIAAQRVTQQVAPQFNSRLDQELAKLNETLHGSLKSRMTQSGMIPSRISTRTTSDALLCGLEFQPPVAAAADASGAQPLGVKNRTPTTLVTRRLIASGSPQLGGNPGLQAPEPYSLDSQTLSDRACLLIHVSLVEDLAERFHLAGKEISDTRLMRILGVAPPAGKGDEPQMYSLLLANERPVSAVVDNGELLVSLRVGIRPVVGPELPTQVVTLAVRPMLSEDQIRLKPELRSIEPLVASDAGQLGEGVTALIRKAIEERLKEFTLAREFAIPRQEGRNAFAVKVQCLTLVDGWITATLEEDGAMQAAEVESTITDKTKIR